LEEKARAYGELLARTEAEEKARAEAEGRAEVERQARSYAEGAAKVEGRPIAIRAISVGTASCQGCGKKGFREEELSRADSGQLLCEDCLKAFRT
jgi:hypothetical protein